jgi:Ca2+:H+ antiporter
MIGATAVIALEAEMVSDVLMRTAASLGLSLFISRRDRIGAGRYERQPTGRELVAYRDKISLALNICVGSAIQMALVVPPLLVLLSAAAGRPMNLVFHNPLYPFAVVSTAFVVNVVARDGKTAWFEGLLLVGVYLLFELSFFFTGPA